MGRPKALLELDGESLLVRALRVLAEGGCAPLVVVLGAAAEQAAGLLPELPGLDVRVVVAAEWASGMGASLRAGLAALEGDPESAAAIVHLVDLPGVTSAAVTRLRARSGPDALARAGYDGRPGHPVLLGRSHWAAVRAAASGDQGARGYLSRNPAVELVDCTDVGTPDDVDTPAQLLAAQARTREQRP